jgi:DNA-directed RNA polymerase subunit RPC12/RpoP
MKLVRKELNNVYCEECGGSIGEFLEEGTSIYVCNDCEAIICDGCLDECEKDNSDKENDSETLNNTCPYCGGQLIEITEDDIEELSFEEMFN